MKSRNVQCCDVESKVPKLECSWVHLTKVSVSRFFKKGLDNNDLWLTTATAPERDRLPRPRGIMVLPQCMTVFRPGFSSIRN